MPVIGRSQLIRAVRPLMRRSDTLRDTLRRIDEAVSQAHHAIAGRVPAVIRPAPRQITIAVTAQCNLLCRGCRYGRDFMVGEHLPLETVKEVLADARAGGVHTARFYGGEPLLHRDLPEMIRAARALGMDAYITTNGTLLAQRIDELYEAGLRWMTIGFYGVEEEYDDYTQREGHFARLREGIETVRGRYGDVEIQINFVFTRRSANLAAVRAAWGFARRHGLFFSVDPLSQTIPFFVKPDTELQAEEADRPGVEAVVDELLRLKTAFPDRLPQSPELLRALPDILLGERDLRVPCDAYQLLWIGADGTVQLCDTHFRLGNVHETPLREILFGAEHRRAARDGFALNCPNCCCKIDSRIRKDWRTRRRYGARPSEPR